MKRLALNLTAALMIGIPMLGGCDETLHDERTVERKSNGTVVTEHEKTTRNPDGSITQTEQKTVDR